jgi:predicted RNA-binding protein YlxR (DUF448 family)
LATTELPVLDLQPEIDDTAEPETGPLRRCIITRERLPKERMIRFVVGPDRQLVPDLAARLPGRGMWLSVSADVLHSGPGDETASRNLARAFARVARAPVTVPSDLSATLQAALVRRITEFLGLARRAGQAVAGYEKAREMLQARRARLLVQAADGSPAERMRIRSGLAADLEIIDPLPGEALGRVFRRDYLVHIAVAPGKLAEALVMEAGRLAGLRTRPERAIGSERTTEQTDARADRGSAERAGA